MTVTFLLFMVLSSHSADCPGWLGLGFRYQPPTPGHEQGWIYVQRLAPGGPAERAGVMPGDVITAIEGQPIRYADDVSLLQRLSRIVSGTPVHMTIRRGVRSVAAVIVPSTASKDQCAAWRQSF